MTDRSRLYAGFTRAAWSYFFLYFHLNLGPVDLLPDFLTYLLLLSAIKLLKQDQRELQLLVPLGMLLGTWDGLCWALSPFGLSPDGRVPFADLITAVAYIYFHFQLFTNFAQIASRYQPEPHTLDRRLLKWRTRQTLLLTAAPLLLHLPLNEELKVYASLTVAVAGLITALCLMAALFAVRRLFREALGSTS